MINIILRTIIIYFIVLILLRIMGKREIGQLSSFDLVVAIIIAETAAIPIDNKNMPIVEAAVPMIVLVAAQIIMSFACLKSDFIRDLIYGRPTTLIKNGKILEKEMLKTRYNIEDLLIQLREKNIFNVEDVEFAILESSGKLSVLPKSQKHPLTAELLGLPTPYEGLCVPLIIDGQIQKHNLKQVKLDENWLINELQKKGIKEINEVFFASLDTQGNLYLDKKED